MDKKTQEKNEKLVYSFLYNYLSSKNKMIQFIYLLRESCKDKNNVLCPIPFVFFIKTSASESVYFYFTC